MTSPPPRPAAEGCEHWPCVKSSGHDGPCEYPPEITVAMAGLCADPECKLPLKHVHIDGAPVVAGAGLRIDPRLPPPPPSPAAVPATCKTCNGTGTTTEIDYCESIPTGKVDVDCPDCSPPEKARPCTCHPDDRPTPCPRKYALSECRAAVAVPAPAEDGAGGELKPCPFCGGKADMSFAGPAFVECEDCEARSASFDGDKAELYARTAWNLRHD